MKTILLTTTVAILLFASSLKAQSDTPKGFEKGTITLSDGSVVSGSIKEKIHSNASVTIINDADKKKKNYDGSDLLAAEIGSDKFICIHGDFFKVIQGGELMFLQKSSDASGKPMYNGTQAVFANGTDGQPGDYFVYSNNKKQLKLLTKKTITSVADEAFAGCNAAISKAKSISDPEQVGEAVSLFNNCK